MYILFVGAGSLLCLFGAYFPLILSHIARYAPSSESKICIQIDHKILLSNFEHLLTVIILSSRILESENFSSEVRTNTSPHNAAFPMMDFMLVVREVFA